jgi:hypothetical protein
MAKPSRRGRQTPPFIWSLLLLLAAAPVWGDPPPPAEAVPAPRAVTGATSYNFGQVLEDQALTHAFLIQNAGTAPLLIQELDPDCACTVASYEKTIPPGGQGEITLTIKPFSVLHQFKKMTKVRLNDPETPLIHLTVAGNALPGIDIQPSHVLRLKGSPGEAVRGQVRIVSNLPPPWKITAFHTNIPDRIEVNLTPEVPERSYVLTVRNQSREPGNYAGLVELHTTSQAKPRLIVRVFGEILSPPAGQ